MATTCSLYEVPYSTSPYEYPDLDFGIFKPDEFIYAELPSIHSDILRMENDSQLSSLDSSDDMSEEFLDIKPEIRNSDCMWSGSTASALSSSVSSNLSDNVSTAYPLSAITGNSLNSTTNVKQETEPITIVASSQNKIYSPQLEYPTKQIQFSQLTKYNIIKTEPNTDDYEQQLQQHSIPNNHNGNSANATRQSLQQQNSMQHIPPGTSLLRKSNVQVQQMKKLKFNETKAAGTVYVAGINVVQAKSSSGGAIQIPKLDTAEFIKDRDQLVVNTSLTYSTKSTMNNGNIVGSLNVGNTNPLHIRPDTPHSLDDDITCMSFSNATTPEFKHNVDLGACVTGSNNISLTNDPMHFIHQLSQELQNISKKDIDPSLIRPKTNSFSDVLDVIKNETIGKNCKNDFYEEIFAGSNSASSLPDNSDPYKNSIQSPTSSHSSSMSSASSQSSSSNLHHHHQTYSGYLHSDHSYTRYKDGMDDSGPNIETPSDSDEEIDVVSIGDKKLPTNPSDKDRRVLQTKVADKFSNARVVKTANGVRTIPARRSVSYEWSYTPASNSPVKSLASSRYASPASTPYHNQDTTKYVQQQQQIVLKSLQNKPQCEKIRKRILQATPSATTTTTTANYANVNLQYTQVASTINSCSSGLKRQRGKKSKHQQYSTLSNSSNCSSNGLKRQFSMDETADTIEKRNLHNDMERQRRIGLKNLFETLKKQIPSIKDKERAPKVNILREAAKLCGTLTQEDEELAEQKALLKEEMRKKQALLARLRAMQTIEID